MEEPQKKKILFAEGFLMISFALFFDILDVLLILLFGAGLVLNSIIDVFTTLVIQFWLIMRGTKGIYALIGNAIEFIPAVNALPARTIMIAVTIYIANKPAVAKVASASKGRISRSGSRSVS